MDKRILEFCKGYKDFIDKDWVYKDEYRINFRVNMITTSRNTIEFGNHGSNLIVLDNDDLQYLYNKYSAKLAEELNSNIESVKKEYSKG